MCMLPSQSIREEENVGSLEMSHPNLSPTDRQQQPMTQAQQQNSVVLTLPPLKVGSEPQIQSPDDETGKIKGPNLAGAKAKSKVTNARGNRKLSPTSKTSPTGSSSSKTPLFGSKSLQSLGHHDLENAIRKSDVPAVFRMRMDVKAPNAVFRSVTSDSTRSFNKLPWAPPLDPISRMNQPDERPPFGGDGEPHDLIWSDKQRRVMRKVINAKSKKAKPKNQKAKPRPAPGKAYTTEYSNVSSQTSLFGGPVAPMDAADIIGA